MLIIWNIETCLAAEMVACFLLMALWNGVIIVANENGINKPNSNSYRRERYKFNSPRTQFYRMIYRQMSRYWHAAIVYRRQVSKHFAQAITIDYYHFSSAVVTNIQPRISNPNFENRQTLLTRKTGITRSTQSNLHLDEYPTKLNFGNIDKEYRESRENLFLFSFSYFILNNNAGLKRIYKINDSFINVEIMIIPEDSTCTSSNYHQNINDFFHYYILIM